MSKVKLFISHSHKDSKIAEGLTRFLEGCYEFEKCELRCSSDEWYGLPLGTLPRDKLRADIKDATMLALISPNSLKSEWVFFELGAAWGNNKQIIPILLSGITENDLPEAMRGPLVGTLRSIKDANTLLNTIDGIEDLKIWAHKNGKSRTEASEKLVECIKNEDIEYFCDRNELKKITENEIRYCRDWATIRDSTSIRSRLSETSSGDHWILVCISPEAFSIWKEEFVKAIKNGVSIDLICNDTNSAKSLDTYFEMINQRGIEGVKKSITSFLPSVQHFEFKAYEYDNDSSASETHGKLSTYFSPYPHFSISFISISKDNGKTSWALIAPYTPFKWEKPKDDKDDRLADWGFILERSNPLYTKYKNSALSLLRRLSP